MGRLGRIAVALVSFVPGVGCGSDDDTGNDAAEACEQGCAATIAANCPNGPANQNECVQQCQAFAGSSCSAEWNALQRCGEAQPVTCSGEGLPVVQACMTEQDALVSCLTGL